MKLYYAPGACSVAAHIVLQESGLKYEAISVSLKDKKTATGEDYNHVNPKGYVPCVILDNGEKLTENAALLAYLGELQPATRLMPPAGSFDNYRAREWLGFINGELHKNCGPLFRPNTPEATIQFNRELLAKRLAYVEKALNGRSFLNGENFTAPDAYLFVVLNWFGRLNIDLAQYPNLKAFHARVFARPAVQQVLGDEGLLKAA